MWEARWAHDGQIVRSTQERAIRVRALTEDIMLCFFWARHFTLPVPFLTQVYKWAPSTGELGLCWG